MENNKFNFQEIVHNLTKRHWVWYTIIISLPTIWFTFIIPVFGSTLGIRRDDGSFLLWAKIVSVVVVIISLLIAAFNNRYASKSEFGELENLRGNIQYLEKITESVDTICDEKYAQIRRAIQQVKSSQKNPPEIISNPSNQLRTILEQIAVCLVTFMGRLDEVYSYKDFFVTLAYNFPEENDKWLWVDGTVERGISLMELTNNDAKSTFNYIRNSKKTYYFNNRKEDAKKQDQYIYDCYDCTNESENKPIGSIFCYNFKVYQSDTVYVDAILSISTQQKRFAKEDDIGKINNARDNLVYLVKEYFGRRILIELGLLYLDYINK